MNVAGKGSDFVSCNAKSYSDIIDPSNFSLGSMNGFFTYEEMLSHLDLMASMYPHLITLKKEIGTFRTHNNNPIYYVKISDNPNANEKDSESQVLYDALHHSREPMSMSQLIFYMYYLLENYGSDDKITHIIDNLELFFVPCVNPDGYMYAQSSGSIMWRKNRRDNGDGTYGVDLNRNYGYNWGINDSGSSPDSGSDTYRGPYAFSEPETQAMRYLCETNDFKLSLNYHAYSNIVIYPDEYIEDSVRYSKFAETITHNNQYAVGVSSNTIGYSVNGDADAWMYKEQTTKQKQFSFTPEVGDSSDGFWPVPNRIIPLAKENVHANLNMALLASNYIGINEISSYHISNTGTLNIELDNFGILNPNTAILSVTSSSPTIKTIGAPIVLNGFVGMDIKQESVYFELEQGVLEGNVIDFDVHIDFGNVKLTKNVKKVYSSQRPVFSDNFAVVPTGISSDWELNNWGKTSEDYYTPSSCITDSPHTNYSRNSNNYLISRKEIDLTNPDLKEAYLNFNAKWSIEKGRDYAQILVYDGVKDEAMCGNYTSLGVNFSIQPTGLPLYDGFQRKWVNESINLTDFLGKKITIKFLMASDGSIEEDGFYIDDFKVFLIKERENNLSENIKRNLQFEINPNPAREQIFIKTNHNLGVKVLIYNSIGQYVIGSEELISEITPLDISNLEKGFYNAILMKNGEILKRASFIKK